MEKYCISAKLAAGCCTRNYLQHVCKSKAKIVNARSFSFVWSECSETAHLYCNGIHVGIVDEGSLCVFPQFKHFVPSSSMLLSIIASFNLYPC